MTRYHLNPDTGIPGRCSAINSCPFGDLSRDHYNTREEALKAYESKMVFKTLPPKTTTKSTPEAFTYEKGEISVGKLPADVIISKSEAELPAGNYWFGDPCYAAGKDDKAWQEWVAVASEASNDFSDPVSGASLGEYPVVAANTLYGDGLYLGSDGFSYGVDAGCLSPVPGPLLEKMGIDKSELDGLGTWINVTEPTKLKNSDGIITFGSLTIDTAGNNEENY